MFERKSERDPVRAMVAELLLRYAVDKLPDMDEETYRKAKITEGVLVQIEGSSWVHGWTDSKGEPGRFKAGDEACLGGMGADQMVTPYFSVRLPKEPKQFVISLKRYLDSNGAEKPAADDEIDELLGSGDAEKAKSG